MKKLLVALALLFALPAVALAAGADAAPADEAVPVELAAPTDAGVDAQVDADLAELLGVPEALPAGDCKGGTGGPCICPQVYEPVCGCDGRDYANSCLAACKVKSWTSGTCDGGGIL
jgi:hypothetical protein